MNPKHNPDPARRAETARANGAKSHGPVTPEGKSRSARNATRHGATARAVVLHTESHDLYDQFEKLYLDFYRPTDLFEFDKVSDIVQCRWRLRRLLAEETDIRDFYTFEAEPQIREKAEVSDTATIQAVATVRLASDTPVLSNLHRYEAHYRRAIRLAERDLFQYRACKETGLPYCAPALLRTRKSQNEPTPEPSPEPRPPSTPQPEPPSETQNELQNEPKPPNKPSSPGPRLVPLVLTILFLLFSHSHLLPNPLPGSAYSLHRALL